MFQVTRLYLSTKLVQCDTLHSWKKSLSSPLDIAPYSLWAKKFKRNPRSTAVQEKDRRNKTGKAIDWSLCNLVVWPNIFVIVPELSLPVFLSVFELLSGYAAHRGNEIYVYTSRNSPSTTPHPYLRDETSSEWALRDRWFNRRKILYSIISGFVSRYMVNRSRILAVHMIDTF
jgi:hypothetical protein